MKKVLVLGLVGLLGSAFAAGVFTLDDAGFDYTESDEGYTRLSYEAGVFTLHVMDDAEGAELLEISSSDMLPVSEDDLDELSTRDLRSYLPVEVTQNSAEVTYEDATLEAIVESYDEQFSALGFQGELEKVRANRTIRVYEVGDEQARVIFTRRGNDVGVYMTTP